MEFSKNVDTVLRNAWLYMSHTRFGFVDNVFYLILFSFIYYKTKNQRVFDLYKCNAI